MKEPSPPDDLEQTILETFDEMHAEAQVAPIVLTIPPEVIESVVAYTKDRSVEPTTLIPLAIKAQENQSEKFSEAGELLTEKPPPSGLVLASTKIDVHILQYSKGPAQMAHGEFWMDRLGKKSDIRVEDVSAWAEPHPFWYGGQ